MADHSLDLAHVLADECQLLHPELRSDAEATVTLGDVTAAMERDTTKEAAGREAARLVEVIEMIHTKCPPRAALCVSGGGIRSATFSLGVLQALAEARFLERFTFLSTVSGGGYIGSWLSSWIYREEGVMPGEGTRQVAQKLRASISRREEEPAPIQMLRAYSNYLTPQLGLLSADTWTLVATVLRNLILNWLVIIPPVAMVLLLPRLLLEAVAYGPGGAWAVVALLIGLLLPLLLGGWRDAGNRLMAWGPFLLRLALIAPLLAAVVGLHRLLDTALQWGERGTWSATLFVIGAVLLLLPISYIEEDLPSAGNRRNPQDRFLRGSLLPLLASGVALSMAWLISGWSVPPPIEWCMLFGLLVHVSGWLIGWYRSRTVSGQSGEVRIPRAMDGVGVVAVGIAGGSGLWWTMSAVSMTAADGFVRMYLVFAVPTLLALYQLATTVFIGIASKWTTEEDREWWARAGAWVLIAGLAWLVVVGAGLLGPPWAKSVWAASAAARASLLTTTGISGAITWVLGRSARTSAAKAGVPAGKSNATMEWALTIAAPVFVVCVVLLIGVGANDLFDRFAAATAWPTVVDLTIFLALLGAFVAGASGLINVNRFSLHAMYRNRLIRAYLGAPRYFESESKRAASPFTGFDEGDNVRMSALAGVRPFHVVNLALNLVRGRRLAWQHRKAAAFSVSALHAGSSAADQRGRALGYQRSNAYGNADGGISLGTALAISGAAVSPNMGYHSSPVVALLLTAFNGRLGWWLANPGRPGEGHWSKDGPRWALRPLFAEAFGLTDETNPYVYLSDGGHFENLGLYEMVLRRCRTIILVDAGCDGQEHFEDLGNALRKIRVDLGIEIHWKDGATPGNATGTRFFKATIKYSACDGPHAHDGELVVLKPAMPAALKEIADGDPVDVGTYKRLHDSFPHESTGDQFFDEEQFESYRSLGVVTCRLARRDIARAFGDPVPSTEAVDGADLQEAARGIDLDVLAVPNDAGCVGDANERRNA